jgi:tRNA modification GTPase
MNALLDKERAIVSPIPGTTRDILEDHMRINGLNFKLMDTAGIRPADDLIEIEGIRRSQQAMSDADLILLVLDASRDLDSHDLELIQQVPTDKTVAVWNKMDLPHAELPCLKFTHMAPISAKNRQGIDLLHSQIDQILWKKGPPSKEEILITNIRHYESLSQAIEDAKQLLQGLQSGMSPEFLSMDMRQCLSSLGKIIGLDITEDILSAIFSKFCIGK